MFEVFFPQAVDVQRVYEWVVTHNLPAMAYASETDGRFVVKCYVDFDSLKRERGI